MNILEIVEKNLLEHKYNSALNILLELATQKDFHKNDIFLEIGKIYSTINNFDKALNYFDLIINSKEEKDKYMAYFEIGKIYNIKNDYKKAIINLKKALSLINVDNEMIINITVLLAKTYRCTHEYDSAIEILNNVKNIFNSNNNIIDEELLNTKEALYQRFPGNYDFNGDYGCLINNYLKILSDDPFNSQVLCFLAQAYNYIGLYDDMIKLYQDNVDKISNNKFFKNKFLNEYEIASKRILLQSKPRNLMVVLSNRCNISCIMCLTSKSKWELPKERLEEIISLFPYLERVMWQGGEVLFLPYFRDILKKALNYPNMRQSLITNFQLADEELINLIIRNNIEMTISIDGVTKNIYEKIRHGGNFEKLEKNLVLFNEIRKKIKNKMILNMNVVVMRENYDALSKFVDFAFKYGFNFICFMPIDYLPKNPTEKENAVKKEQDMFTNQSDEELEILSFQMMLVWKKAVKYGIRIESRLKTVCLNDKKIAKYDVNKEFYENCHSSNMDVEETEHGKSGEEVHDFKNDNTCSKCEGTSTVHEEYKNEIETKSKFLCHLPWYSLTLDFDGSVRPDCQCNIDINVGNLSINTIDDLWNNEKMKFYRGSIISNNCSAICSENCIFKRITEFHLKLL